MRYALIESGIVTNVIMLNDRNAGDFPTAVKLGDRPVDNGDTYTDGKFYRGGVEVLTPMEQAQAEIEKYKAALQILGVETEEVAEDAADADGT